MADVIWTEPALSDLEEIAEYIAINNIQAAKKLMVKVFDKTQRLERFPKSGRVPPEIADLGYREVIVNPCRVFYKVDNGQVFIVHVLRQMRDIRNYILNETE